MTSGVGGIRLTLLSRPECHLCEVAARDLERIGISFVTIDVDMNEALAARYGDFIPVILAGDREVVRAPFTLPALRRALAAISCQPSARRLVGN